MDKFIKMDVYGVLITYHLRVSLKGRGGYGPSNQAMTNPFFFFFCFFPVLFHQKAIVEAA